LAVIPFFGRAFGAIAFVASIHIAVVTREPLLVAMAIAGFGAYHATVATISWWRGANRPLAAGLAAVSAVLAVFLGGGWAGAADLIYAPPILISGFLAIQFGRTLRSGCEPLITRFCRVVRGEVPAPLARYTRTLTVAWTVLMTALTAEVVILAFVLDMAAWSWYANVINPLALACFLLAEHVYRIRRYARFGPFHLSETFTVMLRREAWIAD